MELTSTPVVASSLPADFVRAITAAFEAEYAARFGLPSLPAMLAMFTTRPQPRSTMPGTNARIVATTPSTLTSSTRRQASGVVSISGMLGPTIPAEFTSTSTGPIRAARAVTASASEMSTLWSASRPDRA